MKKTIRKNSLSEQVQQYKAIKAKITYLEAQLRPIRNSIELEAIKSPTGQIITPDFRILLSSASREIFNLQEAKKELGSKLEPFISISEYKQLRIS